MGDGAFSFGAGAKLIKYTLNINGFDRAEMKSWDWVLMFDLFG